MLQGFGFSKNVCQILWVYCMQIADRCETLHVLAQFASIQYLFQTVLEIIIVCRIYTLTFIEEIDV